MINESAVEIVLPENKIAKLLGGFNSILPVQKTK